MGSLWTPLAQRHHLSESQVQEAEVTHVFPHRGGRWIPALLWALGIWRQTDPHFHPNESWKRPECSWVTVALRIQQVSMSKTQVMQTHTANRQRLSAWDRQKACRCQICEEPSGWNQEKEKLALLGPVAAKPPHFCLPFWLKSCSVKSWGMTNVFCLEGEHFW